MHGDMGEQHLGLGFGVGAFMMERYPGTVRIRVLVFMICYYSLHRLLYYHVDSGS